MKCVLTVAMGQISVALSFFNIFSLVVFRCFVVMVGCLLMMPGRMTIVLEGLR